MAKSIPPLQTLAACISGHKGAVCDRYSALRAIQASPGLPAKDLIHGR
jgi:hypothetical protein